MNNAIEFLKKRRSIYAIGKNIELNNEEITELIEGAHNSRGEGALCWRPLAPC